MKKSDVELVHDVYEESHGQRTIRIYGPDKSIIELGELLEVFIKRDFQKGMNLTDLSQKHHLTEEEIKALAE